MPGMYFSIGQNLMFCKLQIAPIFLLYEGISSVCLFPNEEHLLNQNFQ